MCGVPDWARLQPFHIGQNMAQSLPLTVGEMETIQHLKYETDRSISTLFIETIECMHERNRYQTRHQAYRPDLEGEEAGEKQA